MGFTGWQVSSTPSFIETAERVLSILMISLSWLQNLMRFSRVSGQQPNLVPTRQKDDQGLPHRTQTWKLISSASSR